VDVASFDRTGTTVTAVIPRTDGAATSITDRVG
jgi:hypothetical protein